MRVRGRVRVPLVVEGVRTTSFPVARRARMEPPFPPVPPSPPRTPPGYTEYGPVWLQSAVQGVALAIVLGIGLCALYVCVHCTVEWWVERGRLRAARAEVAEACSPEVPLATATSGDEDPEAEEEARDCLLYTSPSPRDS